MTSNNESPTLLVVDDDDVFRARIVQAFATRGYATLGASTGLEALNVASTLDPEMAVVDLKMPGMSGLDLIAQLREMIEGIRIVVLTGYGSIATAVEALKLGAINYLTKPTDVDSILKAFQSDAQQIRANEPHTVLSLEQVEWEHINRVLVECGGNVTHAAKALGIHRRSLQRKLGGTHKY